MCQHMQQNVLFDESRAASGGPAWLCIDYCWPESGLPTSLRLFSRPGGAGHRPDSYRQAGWQGGGLLADAG